MRKSFFLTALAVVCMIATISCSSNTQEATPSNIPAKNAAIENIMTRTSVRQYQPNRSISKDTIEILLRAAMAAPTAVNCQPWQFIVVNERAALDSLASALPYAKMLKDASIAIVTCGDLSKAFEPEPSFWVQDLSAATENLLLAAHSLGLGAVWTGGYPTERMKAISEHFNLPSNIIPLAVVPIGYPLGEQQPKDKWNPEAVHYNRW